LTFGALLVEVLNRDGTHIAEADPVRQDLIGSQVVHVHLAGRLITRNEHALPDRFEMRANCGKIQRCRWRAQDKHGLVAELCGGRIDWRDWRRSGRLRRSTRGTAAFRFDRAA
jgi:hypothetical protein